MKLLNTIELKGTDVIEKGIFEGFGYQSVDTMFLYMAAFISHLTGHLWDPPKDFIQL